MAVADFNPKLLFFALVLHLTASTINANDILGCGGFVKSHVSLDFSKIEIGLYTKEGSLKEKTECAPTNGYYFLPLYEKGEYVLKVHPPAGWSFEPSQVALTIDGVADKCSKGQDINFAFHGFGITGRVITAGQKQGPGGISVQLVDSDGKERKTETTVTGDFHFTPVIPGQYTLKASHPRWKLDPAQAVVQVKEGNTALPVGVLAVKGYDVSGSITSFGSPIGNIYVLLYSKEDSPKFRVEGCKTALLQGVPDAPICHVTTDGTGEFSFGLVPAGEYRLRVMSATPGQTAVSYNLKPESVPFTVRHDSLFIKNAFEVIGFNVIGSVMSTPDKGLSGVRVSLDGTPVGNSDATGKFTLANLHPGVYAITFQHERCEIEGLQLEVGTSGPRSGAVARAARWRVCGAVTPPTPGPRHVALAAQGARSVIVEPDNTGKWCTFLPPGTYTARVEVSEQEQGEGMQFYPLSQQVTVGSREVDGVNFSQLKATLTGEIVCKRDADCASLPVTLRPLSPDGHYVGQPLYTTAIDGKYKFTEVLPGSVEVSVSSSRLCWRVERHNVAVTQAHATVPAFQHTGYVLRMHTSHEHEVEYSSASSKGVFSVPAGASAQCVEFAEVYTLTPRGCHIFQPPQATVDVAKPSPTTVYFVAVAHAVVVTVTSPEAVPDLVLTIDRDAAGSERAGPLQHDKEGGMYVFTHTLHMTEGEVLSVSAFSSSLLFSPAPPQQIVGGAQCQPRALTLRARAALTLTGNIVPPVEEVTITLTGEDVKLSQVTSSSGAYSFGPLDASAAYKVSAHKESYVFSEPDAQGDIRAHKLAEIIVNLRDDADDAPLQGGLVSVSGGSYRRNAASGASGSLRFASLSPGEYYAKPHMKEFRFTPPHHILQVEEGRTHTLTIRGTRVAWSCHGSLVSLAGVGWARVPVLAAPQPHAPPHCAPEDAQTDNDGAFRIRGLLPGCLYTLSLKDSSAPELQGLTLAKAPPTLEIKEKKDITGVVVYGVARASLTDGAAWVRTPLLEHYRTLRLTLAQEDAPDSPLYSTKLDPAGYSQQLNPGLMYVLPRLPADNKTYVLALESSLSKATHSYTPQTFYFNSDGKYKHFTIDFLPKVKSTSQELRQTSLLVLPLLGALALLYMQRARLTAAAAAAWPAFKTNKPAVKAPRPDVLDKASIDHILNTVNPPKKPKKKAQAI